MLRLEQLPGVLWKRRLTFLLTFLVVMAAAAAATFALDKVYSTRAYLMVSSTVPGAGDFEQVQINQVVTKSYAELLQTRNLAERVSDRLPFDADPGQLLGAVDVQPIEQSQLITIEAEGSSPERAAQIANTYARTFISQVQALAPGESTRSRVVLAEPAPLVTSPVRPQPVLYLLVGALLALAAAVAAAVVRHRTDQRLELDPASTELEGLPVLGRIPRVGSGIELPLRTQEHATAETRHVDEAFRFVLANLAFANGGRRPATLAVVSAGPGEGKSTTCASLAQVASDQGVETLLVDGDLRRPRLTAALGMGMHSREAGFSTFLVDTQPVALSELALTVDGSGVSLIPAGPVPPNAAALLGSGQLGEFMDRVKRIYDLTVVDTPPMTVGADASLISATAEGVVLVIDATQTRRTPMLQTVDQLRRANANVLGVIVNRSSDQRHAYYGFGEGGSRRRARRRMGDEPEPVPAGPREA